MKSWFLVFAVSQRTFTPIEQQVLHGTIHFFFFFMANSNYCPGTYRDPTLKNSILGKHQH